MTWKCQICGIEHEDLPTCFGIDTPPWRDMDIPEDELEVRVDMNRDQCVVDERHFFIRGHIEIPILGADEPLSFSVWSSLSEKSFLHVCDRWDDDDRDSDPPYFGWLSSPIWIYPSTINLKLSVQSRKPGLTPIFTVGPCDHPLAVDQHHGISISRWQELAHQLLHA